MGAPKAPKDAQKKRPGFFIKRGTGIFGLPMPDGRGIQFIFLSDGRINTAASIVGNITDESMIEMLATAEGFRKIVHSIGVRVTSDEADTDINFAFQFYGKTDPNNSGTTINQMIKADSSEYIIVLDEQTWSDDDDITGQMRFEFPKAGMSGTAEVKLYLNDGYDAPEPEEDAPIDFEGDAYKAMIEKGIMKVGNNVRLKKALAKAKAGEDMTVAFIGGSITQGAGAIPINKECYARLAFEDICRYCGRGFDENIHFVKAGVGGTPSELGMIRYDRDVLRDCKVKPDILVVEFAVNDEGDETCGECFDSLVRKAANGPGEPAVILLYSVFADDYNLQERLAPVGEAYDLMMISVKDAVKEQFYLPQGEGRVLSKAQYFYDRYHPTNAGHRIMADCLLAGIKAADARPQDAGWSLENIAPPIGGDFENVVLLDRKDMPVQAKITAGTFCDTDTELQAVEMDDSVEPVPEFPYNWHHKSGGGKFEMSIKCKSLLIVSKDSGSTSFGRAEVKVDGKTAIICDPHINGWTHCNPLIVFRGEQTAMHNVEITMAEGDEDKEFTILGFGVIK